MQIKLSQYCRHLVSRPHASSKKADLLIRVLQRCTIFLTRQGSQVGKSDSVRGIAPPIVFRQDAIVLHPTSLSLPAVVVTNLHVARPCGPSLPGCRGRGAWTRWGLSSSSCNAILPVRFRFRPPDNSHLNRPLQQSALLNCGSLRSKQPVRGTRVIRHARLVCRRRCRAVELLMSDGPCLERPSH